jgi:hypothetical protein
VLCARPGGEIVAALSNEFQGRVRAKAVDLSDVLSKQREKRRPRIES